MATIQNKKRPRIPTYPVGIGRYLGLENGAKESLRWKALQSVL